MSIRHHTAIGHLRRRHTLYGPSQVVLQRVMHVTYRHAGEVAKLAEGFFEVERSGVDGKGAA